MFSWTCKICGRDNPPSASNCLSCGARFDAEPEPEGVSSAAMDKDVPDNFRSEVESSSPPETPIPADIPRAARKSDPQPTFAPPISRPARDLPSRPSTSTPAKTSGGLPTWLLVVLFFFAIVGVSYAIYSGIDYFRNRKQATSTGLDPAANTARTKLTNPLQKYVEVVGIRLVQDAKRKPQARFVVINHSPNSLDEMSATVTLWASTSRSEEDSVGTFAFKIPSLSGYGSKELTAPLNTKLKFYELPDWQNTTPEIQITSP